jgi:SAM-dependent methyltransferase
MRALVPPRRDDPERMDRSGNAPEEIEGALRDIRLVNRFLGGATTLLAALKPYLQAVPPGDELTVLDVGTGAADLPEAVVREGRRLGIRARVTAVDRDPFTARMAARATAGNGSIRIVRADAFRLPFRDGSFGLVTASMFLHHFAGNELAALLREFRRLASDAVVVNDLERHRIAWAFIALVSRATRRNAMFVHDAPLSVLRGFTPDELRTAARAAGVQDGVRVWRRWPYRLVMVLPGGGP